MVRGPSNDPANRLGDHLLKRREDKGWTLAEVQEETGLDKAVLSRVERGESTPSMATLYKLRDFYALGSDEFYSWLDMLEKRERIKSGGAA